MMGEASRKGCLGVLLGLFGIHVADSKAGVDTEPFRESGGDFSPFESESVNTDSLPFRVRDDFLSPAELSFYRVLKEAIGDRAVICCKVRLGDLFYVARPNENAGQRNRINQKHVDFLLCDPTTMKPRCGIELDDASHGRRDRQERDELIANVFEAAGLALVRIPAQFAYNTTNLLALAEPHLSPAKPARPAAPVFPAGNVPMCPKCGVPMMMRTAAKGPHAGERFYGCPSYPKCRETAKV